MKNKRHLFIPLFIFIGVCIIGLVISAIDFIVINKTDSYSYETIQFNYDGASDGVDPNGNPFNPVTFLTDEVIEHALNECGLNYEVKDIKQYVLMENIVPKNIVDEIKSYTSLTDSSSDTREITTSDYRPVRYRFILSNCIDKKLSSNDLSKLLDAIVNAYCESFYSSYKTEYDISSYSDMYHMDNYDYIYQAEVFTNKIRILSNNARNVYSKHNDFTVDGKSFNDIALRCDNLITNDISRINNIIILSALSKDIDRLKNYYNYKIEMLNYDKTKYTSDLNSVSSQLDSYQKDSTVYVGNGDNIVKIESNSNETYNSLLERKIIISNNIASINIKISDYQSILDDINSASGDGTAKVLVENYIVKLSNDYDSLEVQYRDMIEKYNDKYVLEGSIVKNEVKYNSSSLISSSFVVRCIKICGPMVLVTLLGICVFYLSRETKKSKTGKDDK